jgi:hypothetical protein
VRVTFDPAYEDGDKTYAGTFYADPAYPGTPADSHDIAVVVLDDPIKGIKPAALPEAGSLSALPADQKFTSVGYGAYEVTNGPGGHRYLYDDVRQYSTGTLNATNKTWLRISMNASTATAAPATATPAAPTSSATPASSRPSRSPATPCAARQTWSTASTPSPRAPSSTIT